MERAAATIRDYREQINFSETPANDTGPADIVYCLNEVAKMIEEFSDVEVAETIMEAIGVIQAAQILLAEKREIERGAA